MTKKLLKILLMLFVFFVASRLNVEKFVDWRGIEHKTPKFKKYKISDSRFWTRMLDFVAMGETRNEYDPNSKPECRGFFEQNDMNKMEEVIKDPWETGTSMIMSAYCTYPKIKEEFSKNPKTDKIFAANSLISINSCPYQGYKNNIFSNYSKPGYYPPGKVTTKGDIVCNVSSPFNFEKDSLDGQYLCNGKAGSYNPASQNLVCGTL